MMGYPMTYARVVMRNGLDGTYRDGSKQEMIAGDMRRVEVDQRDAEHLRMYAIEAGVTEEQARVILDAFFAGQFLRSTYEEYLTRFTYQTNEERGNPDYPLRYEENKARWGK